MLEANGVDKAVSHTRSRCPAPPADIGSDELWRSDNQSTGYLTIRAIIQSGKEEANDEQAAASAHSMH